MARIIEKTLYQFDELSDSAKVNARDWYRGLIEADEIADDKDDWSTIADILGIKFRQRSVPLMGGGKRDEPVIYWSLDPSECAFEGTYRYAKGAPKAIRQHAPEDAELHRIADELQQVQRKAFYRLACYIGTNGRGDSMTFEHTGDNPSAEAWRAEDTVNDLLRAFAEWIVRQIEAQRDYLFSDESVDDSISCNEYEFDEDGRFVG